MPPLQMIHQLILAWKSLPKPGTVVKRTRILGRSHFIMDSPMPFEIVPLGEWFPSALASGEGADELSRTR